MATGSMTSQRHPHRGIGMTSQRTRERLVGRLQASGVDHPAVLEVMRWLPRHLFVDEALASRAYEDTALPIGLGQTISQPRVVARMSAALVEGRVLRRVLEVGTGSGYQCAVLSQLAAYVYSLERIRGLLERSRSRLRELEIHNVELRHGDGSGGWPERAPFDGIMVTAAAESIPSCLCDQLAIDARLIAPIGAAGDQELVRIVRTASGFLETRVGRVSFVPLRAGLE
jgi:protein-L-isoaspartate(D-aspartate) O-methyltransferase